MERTYVFNQDGGTGANNGLLASILPSLQNRGIDTGYLMGLMGGNGNGGFFGNNGGFQDIIALIVIAAIFGNGNFGFGGNNNQGANEGREMIMQTLNRNGVDIAALAQAVNTSQTKSLPVLTLYHRLSAVSATKWARTPTVSSLRSCKVTTL